MLQLFLDETPAQLFTLRTAIAADDACTMQAVAHSFKSSSMRVGAVALAGLYQVLEVLGRQQSTVKAAAVLQQLEDEYTIVARLLRAELSRASGAAAA